MDEVGLVCFDIYRKLDVGGTNLFSFIFGIGQTLVLVLVLVWLRHKRKQVKQGREGSVQALVLPIYEWLLVAVALGDVFQSIVDIACGFWDTTEADPLGCAILHGAP